MCVSCVLVCLGQTNNMCVSCVLVCLGQTNNMCVSGYPTSCSNPTGFSLPFIITFLGNQDKMFLLYNIITYIFKYKSYSSYIIFSVAILPPKHQSLTPASIFVFTATGFFHLLPIYIVLLAFCLIQAAQPGLLWNS